MKTRFRWALTVLAATLCIVLCAQLWYSAQEPEVVVSRQAMALRRPPPASVLSTDVRQCPIDEASWVPHHPTEKFVKLKFGNAHAYSAHYDVQKKAVMILLDVAIGQEGSALSGMRCLLEYASFNVLLDVPARQQYRFNPMSEKSHANVLYECLGPTGSPADEHPQSVGLWEAAAAPCTPTVILPVSRPSGAGSSSGSSSRHRSLAALDRTVNFTVCCSPFSRNFSSAVALAEFIEVNSMFGAQRFVFYNYSSSGQDVWRLLDAYIREGVVAVVPWPLYDGGEHQISYFAQQAAFQDCLYRNRETALYVAVMDLDEFIVPRATTADGKPWTWGDIASKSRCGFTERPESIGTWQFRNTFFKLEWPDGQLYGAADKKQGAAKRYGIQTLLKTWREKLIWRFNERTKYFVLARRADYLLVHTPHLLPGFEQCPVPIEEAMLHHYRDWGDRYVEAEMLSKGVEDAFLASRYGAEIERRISRRLQAVGVTVVM